MLVASRPTATAAKLGADLRAGKIDACDLIEETLAAIARYPDTAIFIKVTAERARREALAARTRLKAGKPLTALDGVPCAWKDLFDVEGRVTTAGSRVLAGDPPAKEDAALIKAGGRAGLVLVGLVNMTEFAYSGIGLNPHFGTPRNPRDPHTARSPGGSSSGSGAVVAAGLTPLAIGTDTGGSVRVPASFNGVVGYKSSTGHFPMEGVFPLSRTLDTLGPLAHTVEDCVLADAALRGEDPAKAHAAPIRNLKIFVPETIVLDGCQEAVLANFESALSRLQAQGAKIERGPMPELAAISDLIAKHGNLLGLEALHVHKARVTGPDAERIDRRVVARIRLAESMTALDLVEILETRKRLIAEANARIGDRIIAFPTTPQSRCQPRRSKRTMPCSSGRISRPCATLRSAISSTGAASPSQAASTQKVCRQAFCFPRRMVETRLSCPPPFPQSRLSAPLHKAMPEASPPPFSPIRLAGHRLARHIRSVAPYDWASFDRKYVARPPLDYWQACPAALMDPQSLITW